MDIGAKTNANAPTLLSKNNLPMIASIGNGIAYCLLRYNVSTGQKTHECNFILQFVMPAPSKKGGPRRL